MKKRSRTIARRPIVEVEWIAQMPPPEDVAVHLRRAARAEEVEAIRDLILDAPNRNNIVSAEDVAVSVGCPADTFDRIRSTGWSSIVFRYALLGLLHELRFLPGGAAAIAPPPAARPLSFDELGEIFTVVWTAGGRRELAARIAVHAAERSDDEEA